MIVTASEWPGTMARVRPRATLIITAVAVIDKKSLETVTLHSDMIIFSVQL